MADGGGLTFPIPLLVVYAPAGPCLLLEISILKKTPNPAGSLGGGGEH